MRRATGRAVRVVLAGGLLAAALSGCGVPLEDEAQPLPGGVLPMTTPTPSTSPQVQTGTMYFVLGPALVGVPEPIPARTAAGVMEALRVGPPPEQLPELRSLLNDPLTQTPMLTLTGDAGRTVTLQRSDLYLQLQAAEQVLLIGQVVLSLADVGVAEVVVTDAGGTAVPLPLPDGTAKLEPVTAADYESLLVPEA